MKLQKNNTRKINLSQITITIIDESSISTFIIYKIPYKITTPSPNKPIDIERFYNQKLGIPWEGTNETKIK